MSRTDPLAWLQSLEGVPSGFQAARDGIDAVLRDRGLRRTSPETTAESLLRGAHASAVLEGSLSSLAEVREGTGDEVAEDAVRVSLRLLASTPLMNRAPLQALAQLHALAAGSALPDDEKGRPRSPEAAERLQALARLLSGGTEVPALMLAAVVHAEIASTTPFASHNGIVARAAERLVLAAKGVDEKSLIVPEAAHLALRREYESNLRGYATGGQNGVHAWLLYAAEAYAAGADASPLRRTAE